MPWTRAKALPPPDNALFEACFRIQREAIQAAGHFIPLVVENVRGAQKWVGSVSDRPEDVADPFPSNGRGAILVPTADYGLFAFDRDSGQPLWNRIFENRIEVLDDRLKRRHASQPRALKAF